MSSPNEPEDGPIGDLSGDEELTPYIESLLDGDDILLQGVSGWGPTRFSLDSRAEDEAQFQYFIGTHRTTERGDKFPIEQYLWNIDESEVRKHIRETLDDDRFTVEVTDNESDGSTETEGGAA